jgi:transcription elongation GreA/GreB family factor
MKEMVQMLPRTRESIQGLLKETETRLAEIAVSLRDFGADGDAFDDRLMLEHQKDIELLEKRKRTLGGLVSPETRLIQKPASETISVGHEVILSIQDGDGQSQMVATIGTTFDKTYLNGEGAVIVSEESPMGKLLLGKSVGVTIKCDLGDIKQIQILDVHSSPLLDR